MATKKDAEKQVEVEEVKVEQDVVVEAVPDLLVEELQDGTRVTSNAHGDTIVEQPGFAPYRENTQS